MSNRLIQAPRIDLDVLVRLNEMEICALDALVGYGIDPFLEVFYSQLGKVYMQPHEAGLRSLFDTIGRDLRPILRRVDAAKKAFALHHPIIHSREHHDALLERIREAAKEAAKGASNGS
jgi:hypothetical protein